METSGPPVVWTREQVGENKGGAIISLYVFLSIAKYITS